MTPALTPARATPPRAAPRLDRARGVLAALAVEGVVELAAAAIADALGVSTRALRGALSDLEKLGELAREGGRGRGRVMRLVLRKPEGGSRKVEDQNRKAEDRKPEGGRRKAEGQNRKVEAGNPKVEHDAHARSLHGNEQHDSPVVPLSLQKSSSSVSPAVAKAEENRKAEGNREVLARIEAAVARFEALIERAERAGPVGPAATSSPRTPVRPSERAWRPKSPSPVWGPTDDERRAIHERARAILTSEKATGPHKTIEAQLRDVTCYPFEDARAGVAHVELALARGHDVRTKRGSFWDATRLLSFKREELAVAPLDVVDAELERLRRPVPQAPAYRDPVLEWHEREAKLKHQEILRSRGMVPRVAP